MAKPKKTEVSDYIDWYLISIDRLKQIGLVVLVLILGGAGWWYYRDQKGNPRAIADSAIADARQELNALAASKDYSAHHPEFDRAKFKLDEATSFFNTAKYTEAQSSAIESRTISRVARVGTGGDRENDAQFLTVEGDVQFQKSATSDWKRAEVRLPLFNGDWVKTADNASAELIFSNGSLFTIGPNALLEIYAQVSPGATKKTNGVTMQVGPLEVATTDDASTVRTPGSQVVVDSESTTQVGVDQQKQTAVVGMKGSAVITSTAGGEPVKLTTGEKVSATPTGNLTPVKKLALPPGLLQPSDNQVFQVTSDSRIDFSWAPATGAKGYQLQVSRSRLFPTLEINVRRQKTSASARATSEGMFYWRVASIGPDGEMGPFSPPFRFRMSGGGTPAPEPGAGPTKPPSLVLKAPFGIGGPNYIVEGATDPGSTVFINNGEVEVESNGHFKKLVTLDKLGQVPIVIKAVSPSGVVTVQSQTVLVEE